MREGWERVEGGEGRDLRRLSRRSGSVTGVRGNLASISELKANWRRGR